MAVRKFRWSIDGGATWTVEEGNIPFTLPVDASDTVIVEPIGIAVTAAGDGIEDVLSYSFSKNYPSWTSNPLGYIHPNTPAANGRVDYFARVEVLDPDAFPNNTRLIGQTPATGSGISPVNGLWWISLFQKKFSTLTTAENIASLPCTVDMEQMAGDSGNWNALNEIFLSDGAAEKAEIGFIRRSPDVTKTWFAGGALVGTGMTDRYGRLWSCRFMGINPRGARYYVFIPTAGDFFSGSEEFADAIEYLLDNDPTNVSGSWTIRDKTGYSIIEAINPGGVIRIKFNVVDFPEYVEKTGVLKFIDYVSPTEVWVRVPANDLGPNYGAVAFQFRSGVGGSSPGDTGTPWGKLRRIGTYALPSINSAYNDPDRLIFCHGSDTGARDHAFLSASDGKYVSSYHGGEVEISRTGTDIFNLESSLQIYMHSILRSTTPSNKIVDVDYQIWINDDASLTDIVSAQSNDLVWTARSVAHEIITNGNFYTTDGGVTWIPIDLGQQIDILDNDAFANGLFGIRNGRTGVEVYETSDAHLKSGFNRYVVRLNNDQMKSLARFDDVSSAPLNISPVTRTSRWKITNPDPLPPFVPIDYTFNQGMSLSEPDAPLSWDRVFGAGIIPSSESGGEWHAGAAPDLSEHRYAFPINGIGNFVLKINFRTETDEASGVIAISQNSESLLSTYPLSGTGGTTVSKSLASISPTEAVYTFSLPEGNTAGLVIRTPKNVGRITHISRVRIDKVS